MRGEAEGREGECIRGEKNERRQCERTGREELSQEKWDAGGGGRMCVLCVYLCVSFESHPLTHHLLYFLV